MSFHSICEFSYLWLLKFEVFILTNVCQLNHFWSTYWSYTGLCFNKHEIHEKYWNKYENENSTNQWQFVWRTGHFWTLYHLFSQDPQNIYILEITFEYCRCTLMKKICNSYNTMLLSLIMLTIGRRNSRFWKGKNIWEKSKQSELYKLTTNTLCLLSVTCANLWCEFCRNVFNVYCDY